MRSYGLLCLIVSLGILLDQASKEIVFRYLEPSQKIELTTFLNIVLSKNVGGVFGLIPGRNTFLIFISFLALFLLWWVYSLSEKTHLSTNLALGSIFAGAAGNLLDRVMYNCVRDFIDLHLGERHWPTFNLADVLICLGVGLMVLNTLFPVRLRQIRPQSPQGS